MLIHQIEFFVDRKGRIVLGYGGTGEFLGLGMVSDALREELQ